MTLNLKNPDTHRLARELASLTGESMTEAVTLAVRERIDRLRQKEAGSLSERLLAIGRLCSLHLSEPFRSVEHGDLLYGKDGLPK